MQLFQKHLQIIHEICIVKAISLLSTLLKLQTNGVVNTTFLPKFYKPFTYTQIWKGKCEVFHKKFLYSSTLRTNEVPNITFFQKTFSYIRRFGGSNVMGFTRNFYMNMINYCAFIVTDTQLQI